VLGHHIVLNYIDAEGKHYTLEGVPEHKFDRNFAKLSAAFQEEVLSSGTKNTDSPFKRLRAEKRDVRLASRLPSTLIAEGDDLRSQWERMTDFGDEVNSTGYEYRPYSQNSNSFAAGALKRAGFLGPGTVLPEIFDRLFAVDPVSGQVRPVEVPGFDQHLANPLDKTAAPLRGSVTPFVPANVRPAGEESFDRRFGSSAAESTNPNLPARMRGVGEAPTDADRKPVPYLGRRVVGKPEASTFDEGTSAVPFVPPNEVLSSDRPSSNRFGNWTASPAGITPCNPNLPLPATEPGRPPGIFNGKPMPLWTTPPPIRESPDSSEAPGIGTKPIRYLSRRDGNAPPASVFDTGAPAVQFVLPDQLNSFGGATDWAAALAGRGPLNPMQAAPPPQAGATPGTSRSVPLRILSRKLADEPPASVFDTSAPAVPFAPSNEVFSPPGNAFVSGSDASFPAGDAGGSSMPRPQGLSASALLAYIRHLNQLDVSKPHASILERVARRAARAFACCPAAITSKSKAPPA